MKTHGILWIIIFINTFISLNATAQKTNKTPLYYFVEGNKLVAKKSYDKGIRQFLKGIKLAGRLKDKNSQTMLLKSVGYTYLAIQMYDQSLRYFFKAYKLSKSYQNKSQLLHYIEILATVYYSKGDYKKAILYYQQAISRNKELNNVSAIGTGYIYVGNSYMAWGKYNLAIKSYETALTHYKERNKELMVYNIYSYIASAYSLYGKNNLAIDRLNQSLKGFRKLRLADRIIETLSAMGYAYIGWAKYDKSIQAFNEALTLSRTHNVSVQIPQQLSNIGKVYETWGKYDRAEEYLKEAGKYIRKQYKEKAISRSWSMARNYSDLAHVYKAQAQYGKAISYYYKSLNIYKSINPEHVKGFLASSYTLIGHTYKEWGRHDKAIKHLTKAVFLYKTIKNRWGLAWALNILASAEQALGRFKLALNHYTIALKIYQQTLNPIPMSNTLNKIGGLYYEQKKYRSSISYYNQAIRKDQELQNKSYLARDYHDLGKLYFAIKKYRKAKKSFIEAVRAIELLRKDIGSDTITKATFLAKYIFTYKYLISACYHNKDYRDAFFYTEQSKSRSLLEELSRGLVYKSFPFKKKDRELLKKMEDYSQQIVALENKQTELRRDPKAKESTKIQIDNEIIRLKIKYQNLDQRLINKYPKLKKLMKPEILKLEDAQKIIPKGTVVLEYNIWEEGESQLFLITHNEFKVYPLSKTSYSKLVKEFREYLSNPEVKDTKKLSQKLYNLIILPVEAKIKGKKLVIIPDGILNYLPFETLKNKRSKYLIENYDISYIQSLSVLKSILSKRGPGAEFPFFGLGGAIYQREEEPEEIKSMSESYKIVRHQDLLARKIKNQDKSLEAEYRKTSVLSRMAERNMNTTLRFLGRGDFEAIPGTLKEVKALEQMFYGNNQSGHIYTKEKASEITIKSLSYKGKLKKYRFIHLSTHGFILVDYPNLSSVVLSQKEDQIEDGYLRMGEILGLELNADLTVLSACETGLGKSIRGEGILGLTRSFMFAGSKNLVVSLWAVADEATSKFMIHFYSLIKGGMSISKALRRAKQKFIQDNKSLTHPYYWSPFVLYGI